MRCEQSLDLVSRYCEGSLEGALLVAFQNHLQGCQECRDAASDMRRLYADLSTAPVAVEPPADFRAHVWRKIDEASAPQAGRRRSLLPEWRVLLSRRGLVWAAAAVLLVALWGTTVPGTRVAAWLGLPVSVRSPADEVPVVVGPATVHGGELRFRLTTSRSVPVQVSVSIAGRAEEAVSVAVEAGQPAEVALPGPASGGQVLLRVSWEHHGEVRSQTMPLRVR
ncbi:MAG TPA: zf-HC2 domain-containing protein [Chthonomonadales bacterium]|nr:zf-HC2 domain-containing protein [Chthonomonadales bacterium]